MTSPSRWWSWRRHHRFSALLDNWKTIVSMVTREKQPFVLAVLSLILEKVESIGLVVLK